MRAREIVLALLIILAGVSLSYFKSGRLSFEGDDFFGWSGREFQFEETRDIPGPAPAWLEIANSHGAVAVESAAIDQVRIVFTKRVWRKDEAAAKTTADAIRMIANQSSDRLILSTNREDFKTKRFETDFKVLVPAATSVLIKNSYGPVKASGVARAELINSHGRVSAAQIAGPLVVRTSYEPVDADGIAGDCRIEAPHGEVNAHAVEGDLIIENSYERIRVERTAKALTVSGSHSDILAKDIGGRAEIGSSYEAIRVVGALDVKIRGLQSEIELADIKGAADVSNDHGFVRARNVSGGLKIEGRDVGVSASGIAGPEIKITTSYQDVDLLDFTSPAVIVLSHGDLRLRPLGLAGAVDVQGSYAGVDLEWPAGVRGPLEARTTSGEINWMLAEKPASLKTNGSSEVKAFTDAAGKPGVTIVTTYGDVRVRDAGSTDKKTD
ncbi:MAG: DUF4097 family beta strand repeat-containing protein [Candidatus Aminicenantes bacterium]|nr:DUF4097 family beta strand repeat-containing protein [Candidatus Aminicenantes bacterium]